MKSLKMKAPLLSLVAMAVVGSASAQSSFTIDGNIDVGYKSVSHTDPTKNKDEFVGNNSSTSAVNFKGVKDLGDGMRASFLYEIDPNAAQTNTLNGNANNNNAYTGTPFNGETYVSLAGNFGQVKLGTPNAAALTAGVTAQPFGTALGGGFSGGFGRMGTTTVSGINEYVGNASGRIIRHEKTVMYSTPVFGGGFVGNIEYALGNSNSATITNNTNTYTAASLQYNAGPLNAIYSYTTVKAGSTAAAGPAAAIGTASTVVTLPANSTVNWSMLAANYNFGALTVYAGLSNTKQDTGLEDSASWNVAAKYAVTPKIEVLANYLVRNSNLAADQDATLIGLGANYDLGNKANLYFRLENIAFVNQTTGPASQVQNTWAAGVRVQF